MRLHLAWVVTLAAVLSPTYVWSQPYPAKPVRLIVPFSAGGGADIVARLIGRKLGEIPGRSYVVDNRVGASGIIASELVAKAAADGHTLLMGTSTHATNAAVYPKLPYDSIKDFAPVTLYAQQPFVLLVHPSLPVKTIRDLIAFAKARPGQLSYASGGVGSISHMGFELFNSMAGITGVHVPYKGLPPATADTMAGNITMTWNSIASAGSYITAGRLRALGTGSLKRSSLLPEVPTISESGVNGFELTSWYGIIAPAATPPEIIRQLQREVAKAVSTPVTREEFAALGAEPVVTTPEEFAAVLRRDIVTWAKVAREANVKVD